MAKKAAAGAQSGTAVLEHENGAVEIRPLPSEFRSIPLAAIAESRTLNTRAPITEASVKELAESMKHQGLLQPIVVGDQEKNGSYQVLAGRRRLKAAELLGWERINACVLDGGAARALEVLVTENQQREEADALLEADVVAKLLQRKGWGQREVAAALGRSQSWVARRAALTNIAPLALKDIERHRRERDDAWPITWLEELAVAPLEAQGDIVDRDPFDLRELRKEVRAAMGSLSAAPFALDDAKLLPKAGACVTCTKHSAASPALFPEEPALHVLKTALCRDRTCFAAKRDAFVKSKKKELEQAGGEDLVVVHGVRSWERGHDEDVKAEPAEKYSPAKKGDKGALPALIVDGPRAGQIGFVKPAKNGSGMAATRAKSKSAPGTTMSMAEKRKAHTLRRQRHVFHEFRAELEEFKKSKKTLEHFITSNDSDQALLRLVAAYGTDHHDRRTPGQRGQATTGGNKAVRLRVLEDLLASCLSSRGCFSEYCGNGDAITSAFNDVQAFLSIVGWTGPKGMEARVKAAAIALPEPKSWAEQRTATPAKKSPKGKGRK